MDILKYFLVEKGDTITFTGGGGKTTLIETLASNLSKNLKGGERILITTTTKIVKPSKKLYENLYIGDKPYRGFGKGIDYLGSEIKKEKLLGVDDKVLESYLENYTYILVEGDGSKGIGIKEWEDYEPIISKFSTKVVGVLNLNGLCKEIGPETIHRSYLVEERYKKGRLIDDEFYLGYIKNKGFFKGYSGRKELFINGVSGIEKKLLALKLSCEGEGIYSNIYIGDFYTKFFVRYMKVLGTIMASGYSKRFNGDKLLFNILEKPLITYGLDLIQKLPLSGRVVVGRDKRIEEIVDGYRNIDYLQNNLARYGQSESIKLALSKGDYEGYLFYVGDQPLLSIDTLVDLLYLFYKDQGIVRPIVDDTFGNPVIFHKNFKKELLELKGDTGGREVIKKNNHQLRYLEIDKAEEFFDIDKREDVEVILKRLKED